MKTLKHLLLAAFYTALVTTTIFCGCSSPTDGFGASGSNLYNGYSKGWGQAAAHQLDTTPAPSAPQDQAEKVNMLQLNAK